MTAEQRTMLFSLFARLAKAMGWGPSMRDLKRAELTADVFGEAVSWSAFNDRHVDRMKRRLIACLNPHDLAAQRADSDEGADAAARRRILYGIEQQMRRAGFDEAYVRKIAVDFYDFAEWRELPIPQLENLRNTLANRARRKTPSSEPAAPKPPVIHRRSRRVDVVPDRRA